MARRRSRHYVPPARRGTSVTASSAPELFLRPLLDLRSIEDRRTYHPDPVRPAASLRNPRHRLIAPPLLNALIGPKGRKGRLAATRGFRPEARKAVAAGGRLPTQIAFRGAQSVLVCIRRHKRREALFARSIAGGSTKRFRRPRRSVWSNISCRRY